MKALWKWDRGSLTVEAAIVLPVFICVVISLTMLIKLVYVHDVVQHAIDEAANELATYSYIYHVSDLKRIDDTVQDNLDENGQQAEGHYGIAVGAFDTLEQAKASAGELVENTQETGDSSESLSGKLFSTLEKGQGYFDEGQELSKQAIENIKELQKAFEEACKDPKKEAMSIAWMLSQGLYSDAKTAVAVPIVKHTVCKYLADSQSGDIDKSVKMLNIYNGVDGLDFYSSTFFDEDENIDIVVKYKVELPLPIKLLPDIYMVQRSTARAWLNGADGVAADSSYIWKLKNKPRGTKIEEIYGGNLPDDFPCIDIYDAGSNTGTSIKSTDLNSKTYQDMAELKRTLKRYVDDLRTCNPIKYKGQIYNITTKKMILVIPKGSINDNNRSVLEEIKAYAQTNNIELTLSEL